MVALDLIYQYRRLLVKCESPAGLSLEEIERFSNLEDQLFGRIQAERPALIKSRRFQDHVLLDVIDRTGAICVGCPYLEEGQTIELRVDSDDHSYRFAARVQWLREVGDDYEAGLSFEGAPVLVRRHVTRELLLPEAVAAEAA